MTPERYERLRGWFVRARQRDPSERAALLQTAPAELRSDLTNLLAEHDAAGGFLEQPALGAGFHADCLTEDAPAWVGPYRVLGCLGRGVLTAVFRAQAADGTLAAVKVVRPGAGSPEVLARFAAEQEALRRLSHPSVAGVLDAGLVGGDGAWAGQPFLATELVAGQPITDYCDERGLDVPARLRLVHAACAGVQHAHAHGVIHRDVKPGHILVAEREGVAWPKIIDFGIARAATGRLADTTLTLPGELVGTLPYMSPEQVNGEELDQRSDVFALGVVLFELLAGRPPLDLHGLPLLAACRTIVQVEPPLLGVLRPELHGDLEVLVGKAMAKERRRRYASVAELAAELARVLRGERIQARPPGRLLLLAGLVRRHKTLAATIAIAAVLLGLAVLRLAHAEREAVRSFGESQAIASALLGLTLHDVVAQTPGMLAERVKTLEEMLPISRRFLVLASDDSAVQARHAEVVEQLGHAYARTGRAAAGLELLDEAVQGRQALHRRGQPAAQRALSLALVRAGDARRALGDRDGMRQRYDQALRLDEEALQARPADWRRCDDLGWSYLRAGVVLAEDGRLHAAEAILDQACRVFAALAVAFPAELGALGGLHDAHRARYDVACRGRDPRSGIAHIREACAVAEILAAAAPASREARLRHAAATVSAGSLALDQGCLDDAAVRLTRGKDMLEQLVAADPQDRDRWHDLGMAYQSLLRLAQQRGEEESALAHAERTIAALEHARTGREAERGLMRDLAGALNQRAALLVAAGRTRAAHADAARALALTLERVTEHDGRQTESWHDWNDGARLLLDSPVLELRDPRRALTLAERAAGIPQAEALVFETLGRARAANHDLAGAVAAVQEGLARLPVGSDQRPGLAAQAERYRLAAEGR